MSSNKSLTLSIVIPAYNEENHLKNCLDAIAAQTSMPNQVLVIDNNSTDRTADIAKSYSFVTLLREKHQGIAPARNRGFNAAKGHIIGRIDGDTILPNDWVERVQEYYRNPTHERVALTGGGYFYNVRLRRINGWLQSQFAFRLNRLIIGHYILWGSNMAFPRDMWDRVKEQACDYPEVHEDLDLAIHLHRLGYKIDYQATLQVGVYLKRIWENRDRLNEHLSRWPDTLRSHAFKYWWLSLTGNFILKYLGQPLAFSLEGIARLFGRGNKRQKRPRMAK